MIWKAVPKPEKSELMYNFTSFTANLNHLPVQLARKLPRTDSRFRPDQRALEEGKIEIAASEKQRLEEKQRKEKKARENRSEEYEAKFFKSVYDE